MTPAEAGAAPARRVLIIAYVFPNLVIPGGSIRLEKLLKYLPARWEPRVLSVDVPEEALSLPEHRAQYVTRTASPYRTFARTYRAMHLQQTPRWKRALIEVARRLKNLVLVPDDAVLWWPRAFTAARALHRATPFDAIFASGPPFSCLVLGAYLGKKLGIPFVADLRDDWADNPLAGARNWTQALTEKRFEAWTMRHSAAVVHVTPASLDLYRERYPQLAERMHFVPNGFDEADFAGVPAQTPADGEFVLTHVGTLKDDRDPMPFLRALSVAHKDGRGASFVQIGATHRPFRDAAHALGLGDRVRFVERTTQREALAHAMAADALVLFPTQSAPTAVPGKAYEYLRSGRPILVLSEPNETTRLMEHQPGVTCVRAEDASAITAWLNAQLAAGRAPPERSRALEPYRRDRIAESIAGVWDLACTR